MILKITPVKTLRDKWGHLRDLRKINRALSLISSP